MGERDGLLRFRNVAVLAAIERDNRRGVADLFSPTQVTFSHGSGEDLSYVLVYDGIFTYVGYEEIREGEENIWGLVYSSEIRMGSARYSMEIADFLKSALVSDQRDESSLRGPSEFIAIDGEGSKWVYGYEQRIDENGSYIGNEEIRLNGVQVFTCELRGGFLDEEE